MAKKKGICPVCGGKIGVSTKYRTRNYVNYEGSFCQGVHGTDTLEEVYCPQCYIRFHPDILGAFILTNRFPFWRKRREETCGSCNYFCVSENYSPECEAFGGIAASKDKACYKWVKKK